MNFKKITHVFAVALAALVGFAVSPAGQGIIHQYPWLTGIAGVIATVGAVYHSPKEAS